MRTLSFSCAALLLALTCPGLASAEGTFDGLFHNEKSGLLLDVQFTGDGTIQEAQLDLVVPDTLVLVHAETVEPGAVCTGIRDARLRVVPPSGGAEPLPSRPVTQCTFLFRPTNKSLPLGPLPVIPTFNVGFQECVAFQDALPCTVRFTDVTPAPTKTSK